MRSPRSAFSTLPTGLSGHCQAGNSNARCSPGCFCRTPRVILLDEPFRAVDAPTVTDLIGLIRRWHQEGRTVIAALHDIDQVRENFDNTLLIAREAIAWGKTRDVLTWDNLSAARHAVASWEEHAHICERKEPAEERETA